MSTRRYDFDDISVGMRVGCALVFLPAVGGLVGLADYAGPGGWRSIAEFIGWAALCFLVAWLIADIFNRYLKHGLSRPSLALLIAVIAIGFALLTYFAGANETPFVFKRVFTIALQVIGVATVVIGLAIIGLGLMRRRET